MIKKYLVLFNLYLFSFNLIAGGEPEFQLEEVAKGIYVHGGLQVSLQDKHADDIANIGFIEGDKCIAVIDTGGSLSIGYEFFNAIKSISNKPICYVINTHVHFDHLLGNYAFKDSNAEFVGHVNLPDMLASSNDFFFDQYADYLTINDSLIEDALILPTTMVEDKLELDLGNRTIAIHAHPVAHSYTDLTVYDNQTKIIFLSDLLFMQRVPIIDGKLKGWLAVMDSLDALDIAQAIPGHGQIISDWPKAKQAQQRYLTTLMKNTRAKIAEGAFMEDVIEQVESNEDDWLLYDESHKRNVTQAFKELEWE